MVTTVAAGAPLVALIELAVRADRPVLLHGRHGIGKSEVFAQVANKLGIGLIVRDLSLMEPPDLVGIPAIGDDGKTHYATPAFLPDAGQGLLVFEELNRCPRYMQSPCLQLLTARQLNDYRLPPGWLPCAAINDSEDGYCTEELDPALLSRFLRVKVVPDVSEWTLWAQGDTRVHTKIVEFVQCSPKVFDDPAANPRAWTYASRLLTAWEQGERDQALLAIALAGILGEKWALAFTQFYSNERRPLTPAEIIEHFPAHRAALRRWIVQGHLDVAAASVEALKRHLQPQRVYEAVCHQVTHKGNVEAFFATLPADLRRQVHEWLEERGFHELVVPMPSRSTRP
jgi:hypothetical protein